MTEQGKAHGHRFIILCLVAMFVLVGGTALWQQLNKPMEPQVIEFDAGYQVRWGNRFEPFVYQLVEETGAEEIRLLDGWFGVYTTAEGEMFSQIGGSNMYPGWHRIEKLPPDAHRRLFEGRLFLEAHLHPEKIRKARLRGLCYLLRIQP